MIDNQEDLINSVIRFSRDLGKDKIAIAFSGGPDSLATLLLARQFFSNVVAIVECGYVSIDLIFKLAEELKFSLVLFRKDNRFLSHDKDRQYRLEKISEICLTLGIKIVWLGHNLRDLLGTFYMRLERASSWWGLAGISPVTIINSIYFCRPYLYTRKEDLLEKIKGHPFYVSPENSFLDEKNRRNVVISSGVIREEFFPTILKIARDRAEILNFVREFCKDNFLLENGYGRLSYRIFEVPIFLMNRILSYCSSFIYPNMVVDYSSRFILRINFNLGGIFFQFKKDYIYLFREKKEQDISRRSFFFDKRWLVNYADLHYTVCKCLIPIRAHATIPNSEIGINCSEFKYILPSFICFHDTKVFNLLS